MFIQLLLPLLYFMSVHVLRFVEVQCKCHVRHRHTHARAPVWTGYRYGMYKGGFSASRNSVPMAQHELISAVSQNSHTIHRYFVTRRPCGSSQFPWLQTSSFLLFLLLFSRIFVKCLERNYTHLKKPSQEGWTNDGCGWMFTCIYYFNKFYWF